MATSWGQRKALGRRYAIDPALQMEEERLAQEYALVPGREARALEAERLAYARQQDEENRKSSSTSSMMGTIGNLGTTALTANYLKTGNVVPQFVKDAGSKAINKTSSLFRGTSPAITAERFIVLRVNGAGQPIEEDNKNILLFQTLISCPATIHVSVSLNINIKEYNELPKLLKSSTPQFNSPSSPK